MMVCSLCGKTGIRWMPPWANMWTHCPHCDRSNCQVAPQAACDSDDDGEPEVSDGVIAKGGTA